MASLENKYGKSAVDATRRNALPPYLDTLFEGGIDGGAGIETHNVTLTTANWSNLQQNVVLTCGATNASDIVCAGDNSTMDADYYLAAFGVKLISASVVEGEEEGANTVTFTFTAASTPTTNINVVIIIVNSEDSASSYLNELVSTAENYKNISVTKANEAAASAIAAQTSADNAAQIESLFQSLWTQYRDALYPIGSIYMNVNNVSPSTLFGGTWEQLENRFLLGAGSSYTAGATGGEATHVLSTDELPAHTHGSKSLTGQMTFHNAGNGGLVYTTTGIFGLDLVQSNYYYTTASMTRNSGASSGGAVTIDATHTHDSVGNNAAHNNMPPYLVVYIWKRTA